MDTQTIEGTLISEFTWTAGDAGTFLLLKRTPTAYLFRSLSCE